MAKYGKSASKNVESAMRRKKKGTLRSGSGAKVKSRKQAIAIGLSEAREKGGKVPAPKSAQKRTSSRKSSSRKASSRSPSKSSRKSTRGTARKRTRAGASKKK